MGSVQGDITRAAEEEGVDPAEALAYADRESSFNPNAGASRTMRGLYQMSGRNRAVYGDAPDAYGQTKAWIRHRAANRAEMAAVLGRDPTASEAYLGHHYGGTRAARTMGMDPNTPVQQVFTPQELAENPHFGRAGTIGALNSSLISDMDARQEKFGGGSLDFSPLVTGQASTVAPSRKGPMDFSQMVAGDNAVPAQTEAQANFEKNKKWAKPGNYRTDLGDQEPAFQKWVADNKVPFDASKSGPDDYDMRGFWKGAQTGDPQASTAPNPNDGLIHYADKWKTPYHKSFSNESQWAQPNAPSWNEKDQLIDPSNGGVVFDEKAQSPPPQNSGALDFSAQVQGR